MMKTCQRRSFKALLLFLPLAYAAFAAAHHPANIDHMPVASYDHPSLHEDRKPSFWIDNSGRYDFMFLADHGHKHFKDLTPEEKEKLRKRREAFHALPKEEQERIYRAREKFRNMPPEKREKLRKKWQNMSPEEREHSHKNKYKHK